MLTLRRALGRVGLAWVGLVACASTGAALEVDVKVGLGGLLVPDTWAPIQVTVTLDADAEPLRGQVVLERPRQAVSRCVTPLEVAPGSRTTVTLAAPIGLASQEYRIDVLDDRYGANRLRQTIAIARRCGRARTTARLRPRRACVRSTLRARRGSLHTPH